MKKISATGSEVVSGLIDFLEESGRKDVLSEVTATLENLERESEGADKIIVKSFVSLTREQSEKLKEQINKLINQDLPLENIVEKKLLGGLTVQVGDWFLDASLSRELLNLKNVII